MLSKRIDIVSPYLTYRGEALANTSENTPEWRIRRIVTTKYGIVITSFALNSTSFSYAWKNRHLLLYGDAQCLPLT